MRLLKRTWIDRKGVRDSAELPRHLCTEGSLTADILQVFLSVPGFVLPDQALAAAVDARLAAILALHPTPGGKLTLLNELNNHVDKKVSGGEPNYDGDTTAVAMYRKGYTRGN